MNESPLRATVEALRRTGQLIELADPVDARLEAAEIQRRVFARGGPAILFHQVLDCRFPLLGNMFGTMERARFVFRRTWDRVRRAIELKLDPSLLARHPTRYVPAALAARWMRPIRRRGGPVLKNRGRIGELPQIISWPRDGGAFITLPQVYSEDVRRPGPQHSNLGMYRIQLGGNAYVPDREVGLHYQIHRGIGVHHQAALQARQPFRISIFVGGHPAMTLAAVMPLPEGMTELGFAGALAGQRIPLVRTGEWTVYGEADFCIVGTVDPDRMSPEGPFGDHLGYYSWQHEFPVMRVEQVYYRDGAIWPFTTVGRPPQEDTIFGKMIHELTAPIIPSVLPGVRAVHAVDAAGVHPLLLAVGTERYTPYRPIEFPQEILTQAQAILGQGQLSLAKYLWILDGISCPQADVASIGEFFQQVLERVDWSRDLHFQTQTTIDTLDYSGAELNRGSKVVIAAAGPARRSLGQTIPDVDLPAGFHSPRVILPGVLVITGPAFPPAKRSDGELGVRLFSTWPLVPSDGFPLVVVVDDSEFAAKSLENFLWVTFTRSNPASDIDGREAFVAEKHWGCRETLLIDARCKPHHSDVMEVDPNTAARVDALASRGGPLARYL